MLTARSGRVYAVAIFLSSSLLFLLEPISAKRLLPLLGGSAAVWTACLAFFQCALLLGYLVAHVLATRATPRAQAVTYGTLIALSLGQLALAIRPVTSADVQHPIRSVVWLLTLMIGLPFVTLSATSPLLQSWYARATRAADVGGGTLDMSRVYRLFAVSNVGSLLALLAYPWLIEPRLSLRGQSLAVLAGFVMLAAICGTIATAMQNVPDVSFPAAERDVEATDTDLGAFSAGNVALWIAFSAGGSVLLSAVTHHITENIATIPLLWIVPLVLYLLTFVLAFAGKRGSWIPRPVALVLGVGGMLAMVSLLFGLDVMLSIGSLVALYCLAMFCICLFCHVELYRRRPAGTRLTTFYLAVAAGGACGAILVGMVAPVALSGSYELPLGLCGVAAVGLASTWSLGGLPRLGWSVLIMVMMIVVASKVSEDNDLDILRRRNFYGTLHLKQAYDNSAQATVRNLYHGIIRHGGQVFREDLYRVPTTYYGRGSGVGRTLDLCCNGRPRRVGVIGLGVGTLAAYGKPGDLFRFYDINPAVEPIAREFFRYLRDSRASIEFVTGDARVSLASEPPQRYDVLVVDAFSGDAIPVHLITAEALALYQRHITPDGVIAFHVSNYFLDLPPVVVQLARNAGMKVAYTVSPDDLRVDSQSSEWMLLTRNESFLSQPALAAMTKPVVEPPGLRLWTDDYNSLFPILDPGR